MKEFFRMVNRITAKQIYVPKILRKYVPTVETKSGTRLKSSINYTPCCMGEAEQLHHEARVLTKEEVEANRSNAYKYLDL